MNSFARIVKTALLASAIATTAQAGENAVHGLLLGAGSGALVGQAIGRNTEATLLGTAVGGAFGFVIGNAGGPTYAHPVRPSYPPPAVGYGYPPNATAYIPPPQYHPLPPPTIHRVFTRDYYRGPKICRETISERGFPGRIVRDVSTTCWLRHHRPYWGRDDNRGDRYEGNPPRRDWPGRY